jgi:hypothetical protein
MISVNIDASDLQRAVVELAATKGEAERALRSTLRKMAAWVRTRSIKGLSDKLKIQQKSIRRRLRSIKAKNTPTGAQVSIWYGLNPIALIHLQARQNARGVRASGGRFAASAFIRKGQVFKRTGKDRLPIEKQTADIQADAEQYLSDGLLNAAAFEAQFFKTFTHELRWQTRKQKSA